jgi:mannose-6-phosphate isomerase
MPDSTLLPFRLEPEYRPYVWGGTRLRPGAERTAEAWVVYEHNRILSGPLTGQTLAEAACQFGVALLGDQAAATTGLRFPLLIKLLDTAAWLSLQVHPNDEQAARIEGKGYFGKTEAWHMLEVDHGAEIVCGLKPGASQASMEHAIREGGLLELMQRIAVQPGDTIFLHPGIIHALGPGLLAYEVQQTSDLTYRVYDWDRPASDGRRLHIEQSLAVADVSLQGKAVPLPHLADGGIYTLAACPYFTLQMLSAHQNPIHLDSGGKSFHALTCIQGRGLLEGDGWNIPLNRFESVLIPAVSGGYRLQSLEACQVLKASVV